MNNVIVKIEDVRIGERRRPTDPEKVAGLAGSIHRNGLLQPIVVTDDMRLIAGRHRLEACRLLGWETIPARISPVTGAAAELAEIDENLMRAELTVLERDEHLLRREQLLIELDVRAQRGDNQFGNGNGGGPAENAGPLKTTAQMAAEAGMSPRSLNVSLQRARNLTPEARGLLRGTPMADRANDLLRLARMAPERQVEVAEAAAAGAPSLAAALREVNHAAPLDELPDGRYGVIYADPPWEFSNSGFSISAESQYATMPTDEIAALDVAALAAEGAVLFMWSPSSLLRDALRVMEAWGFEYVTFIVWVKDRIAGPGWWVRPRHETLLIGRRPGAMQPYVIPDSVISAPRGAMHSAKPVEAYEVIEAAYPRAARVELFARTQRDGWQAWGNQIAEREDDLLAV